MARADAAIGFELVCQGDASAGAVTARLAGARGRLRAPGLPPLTQVASGSYHIYMLAVGLKQLKNRLSEYVRLVASGETVLVVDRDRVVAELVPPREGRSPLLADAQLAEAVRRGWITPPVLPPGPPPPRKPVMSLQAMLRELGRDREDR